MCATEGVGGSGTGPFCITHLFCSIYCSSLTFGIVILVSVVPSWRHRHHCAVHLVSIMVSVVGAMYWCRSRLSHLSVLQFILCVHCTHHAMPPCEQWWRVLGRVVLGPLVEVKR